MSKILCIGNRYVHPDGAAMWVYDRAMQQEQKSSVSWVEGGLGGLNLITHFEDTSRVLLLDYMHNVKNATLFSLEEILSVVSIESYTHESAFYYLLHSLEEYLEELPQIELLSCNPENKEYIEEILSFTERWSEQ